MSQQLMRETLGNAMQRIDLDIDALWQGYVSVGGSELPDVVDDLLAGRRPIEPEEYDRLAQSINDYLVGLGRCSMVPYFDQL